MADAPYGARTRIHERAGRRRQAARARTRPRHPRFAGNGTPRPGKPAMQVGGPSALLSEETRSVASAVTEVGAPRLEIGEKHVADGDRADTCLMLAHVSGADGVRVAAFVRKRSPSRWREMAPAWLDLCASGHAWNAIGRPFGGCFEPSATRSSGRPLAAGAAGSASAGCTDLAPEGVDDFSSQTRLSL